MGKATRWLKGLFGMKSTRQTPGIDGFGRDSGGAGICHNPATIPPNITPAEAAWLRSYYPDGDDDGQTECNKHAIAVAAATAAAADAAVAAAQAAVEVVRLTSRGRSQSSCNNNLFHGDGGFDGIPSRAAVRIQTNFRAYLARKALRALKGLVKIQALVRGYLVRKQATATLHGMQALIRAQATARSKRASTGPIKDPAQQLDSDHLNWARPSVMDAFGAPSSAAQSKRLSASFEARTLNPPIDQDTPKVVEVDIGQPGSRSARKGPGSRTSFSELGEDPSSYQILPPQFQFDDFQPHHQFAPGRISIPNHYHHHQCRHHFHDTEWGLTAEECRSTSAQTTPRGCGPDEICRRIAPLTPTRSGPGPGILHHGHGHGGWGRQELYYYNYPNYMAKTMSFKAKVRSHSAPKQRPESDGNGSKKRMSLSQMMDARNSLSGVRMQRSCSQVQEVINFKNAVMGRLGRSPSS